jgi:hypothetical protein
MSSTTECTCCENGLITCSICHQNDVDFTIDFGNQVRILQIDATIMNLSIEICHNGISDDRKVVLEKLVAQFEQEKQELSKNV